MRPLVQLCMLLMIAGAAPAIAQQYPSRPIHLIVPFGPGGTTDIIARLIAQGLGSKLGSVVVENKPGAGGNIAFEYVAKAAPNGYTLLVAHPAITINPSLYDSVGYDPNTSFTPITLIAATPLILGVHPSLPVKGVRDLIALAKKRPGDLSFASAGNGSTSHLAGDMFRKMAKVDILHVPYKGAALGMLDVVNGTISMIINPLPEMLPFTGTGKMRALATTGKQRSSVTPDVQTISEAALPGYEVVTWAGTVAPAGISRDIINRVHSETLPILKQQDVRDRLMKFGYTIIAGSPEEFGKYLKAETQKWAQVVKASGTKLE